MTNKLKEEELLAWLNIWVRRWSMMSGEEKQAYQQIKEMIQKPEVTEDFVGKWNQVIAERVNVQMKKDFIREEISLVYPGIENLTQMLKEAGIEIVKK